MIMSLTYLELRYPLIERIKSVFRIDPLPVKGYQKGCWDSIPASTAVSDPCLLQS
jgi:hypothetical protein